MPLARHWAHTELLIALNLYCKLSFGQLHARNLVIIDLAEKLQRTPGSVAMKLCNRRSIPCSVRVAFAGWKARAGWIARCGRSSW